MVGKTILNPRKEVTRGHRAHDKDGAAIRSGHREEFHPGSRKGVANVSKNILSATSTTALTARGRSEFMDGKENTCVTAKPAARGGVVSEEERSKGKKKRCDHLGEEPTDDGGKRWSGKMPDSGPGIL